jgi:protein tyrosine/serine phosphatase
MEWIDENVAIGGWLDYWRRVQQRQQGIELCMDARSLFDERFFSIGRRPNAPKVIRAAQLLLDLSEKGVKVMVHCHHGRDRSPFVAMVYLSMRMGIDYAEAFEIVLKGRPRAVFHKEWVDALEAVR